MMFVTLEDATGTVEVLIFPKILEKTRNLWQEDKLVMLTGKISEKDSEPKKLCDSVSDLMIEDIKNMTLNLTIPRDTDKEIIDELKKVLEQEKGNMPVYLNLFVGQNLKKVKLTQGITYTTETKNKLINLLSIDNIRLS